MPVLLASFIKVLLLQRRQLSPGEAGRREAGWVEWRFYTPGDGGVQFFCFFFAAIVAPEWRRHFGAQREMHSIYSNS